MTPNYPGYCTLDHNEVKKALERERGERLSRVKEDGYELWLRYRPVTDPVRLAEYRAAVGGVSVFGDSATSGIIRTELERALPAMLAKLVPAQTLARLRTHSWLEPFKRWAPGE